MLACLLLPPSCTVPVALGVACVHLHMGAPTLAEMLQHLQAPGVRSGTGGELEARRSQAVHMRLRTQPAYTAARVKLASVKLVPSWAARH